MIESTIFSQKGREKCSLATKAEKQPSTKIKTKKKEDSLEVKFKCESGFVIRRTYLTSSQYRRERRG